MTAKRMLPTVVGALAGGFLLASCGGAQPLATAIPTVTPDHEMEMPTILPTQEATREEPAPTQEVVTGQVSVQEIALIENYTATRFFPGWVVVVKDIRVRLYLTRLHREHVNRFTIEPFYSSSEVILPGEIAVITFVPDQLGEFKIRNVGHFFEADLLVVETREEARRLIAGREVQMYALIHSIDDSRMFPEELVVQEGIPARIHNISMTAEHRVSFGPFFVAEDINVRPREITPIDFNPVGEGRFTIRHELDGITGQLVVEENR